MKYHIKADLNLFNEWHTLTHDISVLKAIIQNDMDIDSDQLFAWIMKAQKKISEAQNLLSRTIDHISPKQEFK
jgi:hypothetical protein